MPGSPGSPTACNTAGLVRDPDVPVPRPTGSSAAAPPTRSDTRLAWKRTTLLFVGHLLNDGFASFFAPLLPLLIDRLDLSLALAGALGTMRIVTNSLLQPGLGHLVDRVQRRPATLLRCRGLAHIRESRGHLASCPARDPSTVKVSPLYGTNPMLEMGIRDFGRTTGRAPDRPTDVGPIIGRS